MNAESKNWNDGLAMTMNTTTRNDIDDGRLLGQEERQLRVYVMSCLSTTRKNEEKNETTAIVFLTFYKYANFANRIVPSLETIIICRLFVCVCACVCT